jgi:hypothetical protein
VYVTQWHLHTWITPAIETNKLFCSVLSWVFATGVAQRLCPFLHGHLVTRGFLITHNDAPQSVGLLLDEWSARRRDLYLTTHNTHNRQTSMPPVGYSNTRSQQANGRRIKANWCKIRSWLQKPYLYFRSWWILSHFLPVRNWQFWYITLNCLTMFTLNCFIMNCLIVSALVGRNCSRI